VVVRLCSSYLTSFSGKILWKLDRCSRMTSLHSESDAGMLPRKLKGRTDADPPATAVPRPATPAPTPQLDEESCEKLDEATAVDGDVWRERIQDAFEREAAQGSRSAFGPRWRTPTRRAPFPGKIVEFYVQIFRAIDVKILLTPQTCAGLSPGPQEGDPPGAQRRRSQAVP